MIEQTIFNILSTPTSITSICGTRIYPLVLPESSPLPAIHYSIVGGSVMSTFDTRGTQRLRVEVSCWGNTYQDAVTLRSAVIQAIDGYADQGTNVYYLMPQDVFEHDLRQYRAIAEFYFIASI